MLASLIIKIILSIVIILLFQYLYNYFKTNMSTPLEKNIIETTQKKYEEMYNVLKKESNSNLDFKPSQNEENNSSISMDTMKQELLKYIETLE